jgi:hypothetical protein
VPGTGVRRVAGYARALPAWSRLGYRRDAWPSRGRREVGAGRQISAIAVIRAGALGDFLLGIPALRALRARYPSAALHLVGPLPQARLALHAGIASTLTSVDAPALAPLFQDNAGLAGVPAQFRDLDAAVVWLGDPAAVAANLRRLGAGAIVAAAPFPEPGSRVHVADRLLGTLDPLDVPAAPEWDAGPWLQASAEARRWASEWIAGRVGAAPFIVLHPGSRSISCGRATGCPCSSPLARRTRQRWPPSTAPSRTGRVDVLPGPCLTGPACRSWPPSWSVPPCTSATTRA